MNAKLVAVAAALTLTSAGVAGTAEARGCLKGAVVGGVAGHFAGHHPILGAAAGCAIGHHMAHRRDMRDRNAQYRGYQHHGWFHRH